nr:hypothetical protein [Morchella crassipes]
MFGKPVWLLSGVNRPRLLCSRGPKGGVQRRSIPPPPFSIAPPPFSNYYASSSYEKGPPPPPLISPPTTWWRGGEGGPPPIAISVSLSYGGEMHLPPPLRPLSTFFFQFLIEKRKEGRGRFHFCLGGRATRALPSKRRRGKRPPPP